MSEAERSVNSIWQEIPGHYTQVAIDAFVVMPNHVHGILFTNQPISNATGGALVRAFKARCTHAINKIHGAKSAPVWQRNYYEHVIRDEDDLMCIREYIANNPAQWALDEESPEFGGVHQGAMNHAPTVISLD